MSNHSEQPELRYGGIAVKILQQDADQGWRRVRVYAIEQLGRYDEGDIWISRRDTGEVLPNSRVSVTSQRDSLMLVRNHAILLSGEAAVTDKELAASGVNSLPELFQVCWNLRPVSPSASKMEY